MPRIPDEIPGIETYLNTWLKKITMEDLLLPHLPDTKDPVLPDYLQFLRRDGCKPEDLYWSLLEWIKRIKPEKTLLVHYSGREDKKYHNKPLMNSSQLGAWVKQQAAEKDIHSEFSVPETGEWIEV